MSNATLVMLCLAWIIGALWLGRKALRMLKQADADIAREEAWYAAYERRSRRIPEQDIDTDACVTDYACGGE